ncbi:MAG: endonuclease III [Firmicutes bacterium]|nr:endonuclease III [Bacillota bacterium]
MIQEIINYLDKLFPNPKCELEYEKDYELLIAVMLSAQTTDKRVNMVTRVLFKKYDSLDKLSNADINDIIEIIKPIGTFNKKANNIISIAKSLVNDKKGIVPNDRQYLESLNGVGRKTTNVVLSNLYNVPCIAVDTHVSRVSKRLGIASTNDDVLTIEEKLNKKFPKNALTRLHHQLVLFGRYHCKAKKPLCENCELKNICKEKKKG